METQRRIVLKTSKDTFSDAYELEENVKVETPQSHDVVVRVKACVLRENDTKLLEEFKIIDSEVIPVGREMSGIVTQVGPDVSRVNVGDEVVGMLSPSSLSCACASFSTISEYNIVKKPSKVNFADAACCVGDGVKAYTALHYKANLCGGETVLVMSGASGAGIMAIQLAQSWGAKIITTAHNEEEKLFLEGFQPEIEKIFDFTSAKVSLLDVCLEETGGTGVDCIIDNGVQQFSEEFSVCANDSNLPLKHDLVLSLAVGGRWITAQYNLQLDPPHSKILYLKGATVSFLFKDAWILAKGQQGRFLHILTDLLDKVETGTLKPMVHHTVNFEDACTALTNLHQFTVGNVVLVM